MAEPSKSLRGRLKEGIWDFCERMAEVDAGRRNQHDGIPQQLHDAYNERRRLRNEAPKAKEQAHDAGSGEHHDDKNAGMVDERRKNNHGADKTAEQNQKLRKDKAVDTGAAHGNGKLQKNLRGHGKPDSTGGKTLTGPESSSEELQWTTDRMILGDLDEVPVGLGHSKTEIPRPSNATEEPSLRLRGGAGGTGRKYGFRSLDDEDYHNALREEGRNRVRDRSHDQHVRFVDNRSAGEPHRIPPTGYNVNAGPRTSFGFGSGARYPFDAEKINLTGNQRPGFGASLNNKNTGGKKGAGVKFEIVDSSDDEESDSKRSSHEKGKGKRNGRRPRSPSRSPSPTRTRTHRPRRGKSGRRTSKAAREEGSSSSSYEDSRNDSGDAGSEGSFESANAVMDIEPLDHYAVLGLTPDCSAQEYVDPS